MFFWRSLKKYIIVIFIASGLILYIFSYTTTDHIFSYQSISLTLNDIAIFCTIIPAILGLNELINREKMEHYVEKHFEEYIQDLCLSCTQIKFLYAIIQENPKKFDQFCRKINKDITFESSFTQNMELFIIEIATKLSTYFIMAEKNIFSESVISSHAIQNFTTYLILSNSSKFAYLSSRISSKFENNNDFDYLLSSYYNYEVKDNFEKLVACALRISQQKYTEKLSDKNKQVIKAIPENKKDKLFYYINSIIKKEISVQTLMRAVQSTPKLSSRYIIFLSRDKSCTSGHKIKEYLIENDAVKLIHAIHGDVFLYESKYSHENVDDFVHDELMSKVSNECAQLIFAVELNPTSYYKLMNKEPNEFDKMYVKISEEIDEKFYNELLMELINISGKPIYDLIEKASLDFFSDDLSIEEIKLFRDKSDALINELRSEKNQSMTITKFLSEIDENLLTESLINNCKFNYDRAEIISHSIVSNVMLWRNLLYGEQ